MAKVILALLLGIWSTSTQGGEPIPMNKAIALAEMHSHPEFPTAVDLLAIMHVESEFKPRAIGTGGRGLMQVRKGSFNPSVNVRQGAEYLREMYEKYSSRNKAFQAYNIGPGNLKKGKLLSRSRIYLKKVLAARKIYSKQLGTPPKPTPPPEPTMVAQGD